MQGKDINKSTFFQLFKPIINENFLSFLSDMEADKYFKKFNTLEFIELLANSQINQRASLRDISNDFNNDEFCEAFDCESFSPSQISRRLRDLPVEVVAYLFKNITTQLGKELGHDRIRQEMGRLLILDSRTISLCLSQFRWAKFRETKAGIKLHLLLEFCNGVVIPEEAIVTPAKPADKNMMDDMIIYEQGTIYVFDRAYVDYEKFDAYCKEGIYFVSRLKSNAIVEVIEDYPTSGNITKHQLVRLGKDGSTKMEHPLQLIETQDSKGNKIIIITNKLELSVDELSSIYLYRWQIEVFFKWLKQQFCIKHFYGQSPQAVENQILIALITHCLLMLLKLKTGYQGLMLNFKRMLITCLLEAFSTFIRKLHRKPKRTSKGRRKIDHELTYKMTLRQVIAGESDHLDDLTYDPVLL